jgi:hypothetical protein
MRGWIAKPIRTTTPERSLVAALLHQAVKDASSGSREAREWLGGPEAGAWCAVIGLDAERLAGMWPAVQRPAPSANALRCRLRREKQRQEAKGMAEQRAPAEPARADRVTRIVKILEELRADIERLPRGAVVVHMAGKDLRVELRAVYREN